MCSECVYVADAVNSVHFRMICVVAASAATMMDTYNIIEKNKTIQTSKSIQQMRTQFSILLKEKIMTKLWSWSGMNAPDQRLTEGHDIIDLSGLYNGNGRRYCWISAEI